MVVGNSSVAIGLWPAHFFWTYYCVFKTRRIGWVLKMLTILFLFLPLVIWPAVSVAGSLLGGIDFGFFAPLIATFEVIGTNHKDKCFHCFVDGCYSTLEGSCTVLRDFTDFCFHSYFSFMDDLSEEIPAGEKPIDIRLSKLPKCLLIIPLGFTEITNMSLRNCKISLGFLALSLADQNEIYGDEDTCDDDTIC